MIHRKFKGIRGNLVEKRQTQKEHEFSWFNYESRSQGISGHQQDYSKGLYFSSQNIFN